jgi:GSH-dependent disulfide-bond oxidoreductase
LGGRVFRDPLVPSLEPGNAAVISLYTYETPNGQKASIMLEEVGLPYDVHPVDLIKGEQRDADFLRISPNNKIPAIVDHDGPDGRTTIFESGAILVYLAEKTNMLLPAYGRARSDTLQWLFWGIASAGPGIGRFASTALFSKAPDQTLVRSLSDEVVRLFAVIEKRLSEVEYLAGDFSVADIGAFTWVQYIRQPIAKYAQLPSVAATDRWLSAIAARPAVQKGLRVPRSAVRPASGRR